MILFILNSSSGNGECDAVKALIDERFAALGAEARIVLATTGAEMEWAAKQGIAAGAEAVVAGGGDGTISTVAGVLADSDVPLGVMPLGTLNHFAKDLGIPLKPAEALEVILAGVTETVDVGRGERPALPEQLEPRPVRADRAAAATLRGAGLRQVVRGGVGDAQGDGTQPGIHGADRRQWRDDALPVDAGDGGQQRLPDAGPRRGGAGHASRGGALAVYVVQSEGKLALARLVWQDHHGACPGG